MQGLFGLIFITQLSHLITQNIKKKHWEGVKIRVGEKMYK